VASKGDSVEEILHLDVASTEIWLLHYWLNLILLFWGQLCQLGEFDMQNGVIKIHIMRLLS